MSEIKLNINTPKKTEIQSGPSQILEGGTFVPTVDELGNISWTNNKGLENPKIQNIMGPPGPEGKQGPPGEPGKDGETYQLPIASADTLGGFRVGEGLKMDSLTGILSATGGGGGTGVIEIIANSGNIVDLDDIKETGLYLIKATNQYCLRNYPNGLKYSKFLMIVQNNEKDYPGESLPMQFIFMPTGSRSNGQYEGFSIIHREYWRGYNNFASWKENIIDGGTEVYVMSTSKLFNGRGAYNMYTELNNKIKSLQDRVTVLES